MRLRGLTVLVVGVLLTGCGSLGRDNPALLLSSEEALVEGRRLLEQERYQQALDYLLHAFEIEPNSPTGRDGLLLAADSLYLRGGLTNWVKSQQRYRDFLNRFPTSERAAYAQFQLGMSIARRMEKPDRDQSISNEALGSFQDVRRFYPTSEYADRATEEIEKVRHHLAQHEVIVGRFYLRYQRFGTAFAAIDRLERVLEDYPNYPGADEVLFYLCRAYRSSRTEEHQRKAYETCTRLVAEYPDSRYSKKAPKNLPLPPPAEEEPNANEASEENVDVDVVPSVPADGGM